MTALCVEYSKEVLGFTIRFSIASKNVTTRSTELMPIQSIRICSSLRIRVLVGLGPKVRRFQSDSVNVTG